MHFQTICERKAEFKFNAFSERISDTPLGSVHCCQVCAALVKHRADMEPFITGMKFEDYVNQMALPDTWGGEPELAIAADVLGLPIVVYQVDAVRKYKEEIRFQSSIFFL